MKQGSATREVMKPMKAGQAVSYTPGVVSQIGESLGNHATDHKGILKANSTPMYAGRGNSFTAPDSSCTPHKSGSQRRHG